MRRAGPGLEAAPSSILVAGQGHRRRQHGAKCRARLLRRFGDAVHARQFKPGAAAAHRCCTLATDAAPPRDADTIAIVSTPAKIITSRSRSPGRDRRRSGALRRLDCGATTLNLFIGNEVECGPANLFLRRRDGSSDWTPLLGPPARRGSARRAGRQARGPRDLARHRVRDLARARRGGTRLVLARRLTNASRRTRRSWISPMRRMSRSRPTAAVRMNEYYVSQYLDHTPLSDPQRGILIASRQNQAADGRNPWCLIGSLRRAVSFATDALRFPWARDPRRRSRPPAWRAICRAGGCSTSTRWRCCAMRRCASPPEQRLHAGFFGVFAADHPERHGRGRPRRGSSAVSALPEPAPAVRAARTAVRRKPAAQRSSAARRLCRRPISTTDALRRLFPPPWRHEEARRARRAACPSFTATDSHVVLRAKELRVLRPHGQLLRTGRHLTPDESALTSTVWMSGVFHSMLAQGHVSINRFLSTIRSYLGLFRSQGLRVFVEARRRVAAARRPLGLRDVARELPLDLPPRRGRDPAAIRRPQPTRTR